METELISGIIGASATLIVGILSSPIINNWLIDRNKQKEYNLNVTRLNCLSGSWSGITIQETGVNGQDMSVDLAVELVVKKNMIKGITTVSWKESNEAKSIKVKSEGGFISENYVRLLYQHDGSNIQNYGVMFLHLNPTGNVLEGYMIGFGHRAEQIIKGKTKLFKN